jgi:hypothetical protein
VFSVDRAPSPKSLRASPQDYWQSSKSVWNRIIFGLGSARDSRAHCGDSPQCSGEKVRDGEVAIASTRVACAPRTKRETRKATLMV